MRVIAVALCLVVAVCVATDLPAGLVTAQDKADWEAFTAFQVKHRKSYASLEEKLQRFQHFQDNQRTAEQLTKEHNGLATFGVTRFSDLSKEEFRRIYLSGLNVTAAAETMKAARPWTTDPKVIAAGVTASYFDWNAQGKVTPVRDQGQCGCCWAFSATEEYESQLVIKGYVSTPEIVLSPQQFVDCDHSDQGCNGGFYTNAWNYAASIGNVMQDPEYGYTGTGGSCKLNTASQYNIHPFAGAAKTPAAPVTSASNIQAFVSSHGPASAALDATPLQTYQGGILQQSASSCPSLNHAVLITGYGTDAVAGTYFIVRNSWSSDWGIDGYFWIQSTTCLINTQVYGSNNL